MTIRGPSIIGAGCLLEQGAIVDQSFVADYTRVGGIAQLYQQMIFAGKVISPDGTAIDLSDAGLNWLIDDKRRTDIITAEKSLFKELLTKDTLL